MSAVLAPQLLASLNAADAVKDFTDPSNRDNFFSLKERSKLDATIGREFIRTSNPSESCNTNLFFGFFHDGTRNNYGSAISKKNHAHSNIARLYSCYPGRSVPNAVPGEPAWKHEAGQFKHFFRVYTPGVGSEFKPAGDTGDGSDRTLGAAMARKGEARITWTLLQAINNLHRFFCNRDDAVLISDDEARSLYPYIHLNKFSLAEMTEDAPSKEHGAARNHFESILKRLHKAIAYHMPNPETGSPRNTDPGLVQQIYISVFGFSRGAAAARAFSNWMVALCKLDAQLLNKSGMTLGGFPVKFDFLGLFDTVASVGLANTFNSADGHWGWADSEVSLKVPDEFVECLHLVSAHEVRRSFPLDSISSNSALGSKRSEIVYPGVHSDIGGGYCPREQGKGKEATGADMLSRLPLAHMYRAARLAGVPLKLELVTQQSVKDDFRIAPTTIEAFNHYLRHARTTNGSLTDIMREQRNFYIQWRYMRRQSGPAPIEGNEEMGIRPIDSYIGARQEDRNDLHSANAEFTKEIADFERWLDNYLNPPVSDTAAWHIGPHTQEEITPQSPGFNDEWYNEWTEVARFWRRECLPEGMEMLFDDYVHDSRAWFKISGTEADDVEGELQSWLRKLKEYEESFYSESHGMAYPLTPEQHRWAKVYELTRKVPRMTTTGREPAWSGAGYLRYRKIYAGGDGLLISQEGQFPLEKQISADSLNTAKAA